MNVKKEFVEDFLVFFFVENSVCAQLHVKLQQRTRLNGSEEKYLLQQ